jgi:hypothetical protein
LHGSAGIVDGHGIPMLGALDQAIVDGKQHIAALGQIRSPVLIAFGRPIFPGPTMQGNQGGIGPCLGWGIIVPCQDVPVMGTKWDVFPDVNRWDGRHKVPSWVENGVKGEHGVQPVHPRS